ncbi:hypothetical protein [Pontibaca salina]|uniref:Secreted protein n=1 Tax=Pontibaca salina TaxID=2795731 RepID=A0A934M058_9RHOB|nr:hypothetical protein [Pontibaca salina]MBI6629680.1 hypothetical protein [Pontibaca salina]
MFRLIAAFLLGLWATTSASQNCLEIRFDRGHSSGEVSGQVSDGWPMCFVFGTGAGQLARLELFGSENTCFTVPDVIDCQGDYSFYTGSGFYQVIVFQLFRRPASEQFTLRLSIQ